MNKARPLELATVAWLKNRAIMAAKAERKWPVTMAAVQRNYTLPVISVIG